MQFQDTKAPREKTCQNIVLVQNDLNSSTKYFSSLQSYDNEIPTQVRKVLRMKLFVKATLLTNLKVFLVMKHLQGKMQLVCDSYQKQAALA